MLRPLVLALILVLANFAMPNPVLAEGSNLQSPDGFDDAMQRGVNALNAGDPSTAAGAFREALGLRPDDPAAQSMLGTTLLTLGDPSAAIEHLAPAALQIPDHYPVRAGLAQAYLAIGRPARAIPEFEAAVRLEPGDTTSRGRLATLLMRAGDLDAAAAHAHELAIQIPEGFSVQALVGLIELRRGDDGAALGAFDRALAISPGDAGARYGRAAALRGLGREAEAVEALDRLVNDFPERADAWTLLGDIFAAKPDLESKLTAVGMYRTALEQAPDDRRVLGSLFDLFTTAGLDDEALALLTVSSARLTDPGLALRLGQLHFEREEFDAAREAYEQALARGGGAEAAYRLGVVLVNLAQLEQAEAAFRRAREIDVTHSAALRELGKVLLDRGRAAEAAATMAMATAEIPDDASSWYYAGIAALRTGEAATAVARLQRSIELSPDDPDAHYNLGLALRQAGDVDGSRAAIARSQEMRRAAEAAETSPLSAAERAQSALRAGYIRYRVGSMAGAEEALERATQLAPEVEGGWFYLGLTRGALGNTEGAISALERAAEMNPGRADTWEILARTYARLGRTEEAQAAAERAAALKSAQ